MKTFTANDLVDLVQRCRLSDRLVRHYDVASVTNAFEWKQLNTTAMWNLVLMMTITSLLTVILFTDNSQLVSTRFTLLSFFGTTAFFTFNYFRLCNKAYSKIACTKSFLSDINLLLAQKTMYGSKLRTEILHPRCYGEARDVAKKALIDKASKVLHLQAIEDHSPHRHADIAKQSNDFCNLYDAFHRLGLVSGGYGEYYREAEKVLENKDAQKSNSEVAGGYRVTYG